MNYTISLNDAKYLDLFDDIAYKYLKDCYANDDTDKNDEFLDVEITDLQAQSLILGRVKINFEIRFICDIRFGETHYKTLKCEKIIEYNTSSGVALKLMEITGENDSDSD